MQKKIDEIFMNKNKWKEQNDNGDEKHIPKKRKIEKNDNDDKKLLFSRLDVMVPNEVLEIVFSFLNLLEIKYVLPSLLSSKEKWKNAFQMFQNNNHYNNNDIKCIKKGLTKNGFDLLKAEQFIQKIEENRSVLSGSFVLWCLLGYPTEWIPDDIDVFSQCDREFSTFENFLYEKGEYVCYHSNVYGTLCKNIQTVREYKFNDFKINTINMMIGTNANNASSEIRNKLDDNFDLSFCKCYFDGRNITCTEPSSILGKSCMAKVTSSFWRTRIRIEKYRKRGFDIDDSNIFGNWKILANDHVYSVDIYDNKFGFLNRSRGQPERLITSQEIESYKNNGYSLLRYGNNKICTKIFINDETMESITGPSFVTTT